MMKDFSHIIMTVSNMKIIFFGTILVLSGSIPTVYIASLIADVEYNGFLLAISIALPLLLAPLTIAFVVNLSINLKHVKEHLAEEIEKNKAKDILLFEQARFALMGEMLANISHQWKQPLNTINLSIISARFAVKNEKRREKSYDIIEENVNYLASTINDFMSYFDKRAHSELRNLEDIVLEIKNIAGSTIENAGVTFFVKMDFEDQEIRVASSISQVLINLVNNARDALVNKDIAKEIALTFSVRTEKLVVTCCDNGEGVAEEIREQIFNPYFTTKAKAQGTGIGLYMSKQIVDKFFMGELTLKDGQDKTCFIVSIPTGEHCKIEDIER